ncbi:MAG: hypothetical protein AAFW46_11650 [Pseudomonadota bacterium]
MWKLALILCLLTAPVLAGTAVLVGLAMPELGYDNLKGVTTLGLGGLAAGLPVAFVIAAIMPKGRAVGRRTA